MDAIIGPVSGPSEDESAGEAIPYEEAEAEDDDGIYVVEKITGHEFKKDGTLLLQVKWKGYDKPEDQTLEPESNLLEGAEEILEEYFRCLGGRPQRPEKPTKKRKLSEARSTRKSRGANGTETPEGEAIPDWVPKGKSWEREVAAIETIIRDPETGGLVAFLQWENGRKSRVSVEQCYEKCPMRMLRFYEQHLVFKEG
jgi:chromobox protein 1